MKPIYSFFLLVLLSFILQVNAFAQRTTVSGTVRDAVTKETLPNVSVFFKDTRIGIQTDINGK